MAPSRALPRPRCLLPLSALSSSLAWLVHAFPLTDSACVWVRYSVGAAYGSKFALWDMGNLYGGKPYMTGTSFAEGGHLFRYVCTTHPLCCGGGHGGGRGGGWRTCRHAASSCSSCWCWCWCPVCQFAGSVPAPYCSCCLCHPVNQGLLALHRAPGTIGSRPHVAFAIITTPASIARNRRSVVR